MPQFVEIIFRSIILLVILFFMTKSLGKKQLSQLSIFDYLTGIVLGGIVALHSFDTRLKFSHGLIAMVIWYVIPLAIEFVVLKNKAFRDFMQGKGTIFIQDGKIIEKNLRKERFSADDLLLQLRQNNIFHLSDVEFAVLEPSGVLSVLPKRESQPLTPKMVQLHVHTKKEPITIIMDGEILKDALNEITFSKNWLHHELEKLHVQIRDVFLGQIDEDGKLTIQLYDYEKDVPKQDDRQLLLATLQKCQIDIERFAIYSNNERSRRMYELNSMKLQETIEKIEPYLMD